MKKNKYPYIPLIIALCIVIGIYVGRNYTFSLGDFSPTLTPREKLNQLLLLIDEQYVDTLSEEDLVETVVPRIIGELDPHSAYIPASELQLANEDLEGSFSGIGIQFNLLKDTIVAVGIISGGPSERAGLQPGDRIVTIDDSTFVGKNINEEKVMKKLRGEKGSKVKLGVQRASKSALISYTIARDDVPVNSIDASYIVSPSIGYIKVGKFGRTTYDEFINALGKLNKEGAKSYVIDLRSNSGGYMDAAINMVNEFLPKGRLIVYTEGKSFARTDAISNGKGSFQQTPLVVLTDEWSASASEIFAGAIQDNDRGMVIGRRTFGKGLVQQQFPLGDGSAIRLTIARYYTPSGRSIQKEYKRGNSEDYGKDIVTRYMHGEFYNADSIKQNSLLKYKTLAGRTVYGGGGIMPDLFVPQDTSGVNSYYNHLVDSRLLFQYPFDFVDQNRASLSSYKSVKALTDHLDKLPILEDFVEYSLKKGVRRRPYYIWKSQFLLTTQLYAYIARPLLGDDAFYQILFRDDKTMRKAIDTLNNHESVPKTDKQR